jgi:hypothetical protein
MSDEKIKQLFEFVDSTGNAVKIATETALPHAKDVLFTNKPLPEGCPSRASMAVMELSGAKGRVDELMQLIKQLEDEIFSNYSEKK